MTNAAVLLSDTTPPRARYLLREHFERLSARKVVQSDRDVANSASLLVQQIVKLVITDDQQQSGPLEREEVREPLVDVEVANTASERIPEVTSTSLLNRALARQLSVLLEVAIEERFEDGMDSNLSVGLRVLFRDYTVDFLPVLEERLKKHDISSRTLAEIFYTLGQIGGEETKDWRLATLVDFLRSPSPSVRDAAAVGLAYLDDKRATPYLREAIERETSATLREDLRAVMEQLGS